MADGRAMVTANQVRRIALTLPETEEKSHFGQPDFRVRGKIFVDLSPDGKWGTLKLAPEAQAMLIAAKPDAYVPAAGAWGRGGWTRFVLAKVSAPELTGLIEDAFRLVAPKKLIAAKSGSAPPAVPKRPTRKRSAAKRG
jgi:hypothetical protein